MPFALVTSNPGLFGQEVSSWEPSYPSLQSGAGDLMHRNLKQPWARADLGTPTSCLAFARTWPELSQQPGANSAHRPESFKGSGVSAGVVQHYSGFGCVVGVV